MRKLSNDERPLCLRLCAGPSEKALSLILKENNSGEINVSHNFDWNLTKDFRQFSFIFWEWKKSDGAGGKTVVKCDVSTGFNILKWTHLEIIIT